MVAPPQLTVETTPLGTTDLKNSFVKGGFKGANFTPRNRNKTKSLFIASNAGAGQEIQQRLNDEQHESIKVVNRSHCSSFDDLEDNVDEFETDEYKSFQKVKNPTLINSIAINASKHIQNSTLKKLRGYPSRDELDITSIQIESPSASIVMLY